MSRHNVNFSKGGMRVGVRSIGNENYVDKTQRWVVKAWELSGNAPPGEEANGNGDERRRRYVQFAPSVDWDSRTPQVPSWFGSLTIRVV